MWQIRFCLGFVCLAVFLVILPIAHAEEVLYSYGFEQGLDDWTTDNGVWEICLPELGDPGPQAAHGGYFVAATVCKGNYPGDTDSRLISPSITLPTVVGAEEINLRFWQWFSYSGGGNCDVGYVQISVWDQDTNDWSSWITIGNSITNTSPWSRMGVDLTAYAGEKVKIAFCHTATTSTYPNNCSGSSTGWYIDEVDIITGLPELTWDFECGWDDWCADRGVWQVGIPASGPDAAYSGLQCSGTILDGNYPGNTDSRLISPSITLPTVVGAEEINLRFWQWFSYSGGGNCDVGYVQISVWDQDTNDWSSWITIGNSITNTSPWSRMGVDLTAYAGEKVKIAFCHTATTSTYPNNCSGSSTGWYIDEVDIITGLPELTWDFECGWDDWCADRGVWQVGIPASGPDAAYSGLQCSGTILDGNYPGNTDSRLISPSITLPTVVGAEEINLRFWQWFSYSGGGNCDVGYVQISVMDQFTGNWSDWTNLGNPMTNSSNWSPKNEDLTAYAGEKVKIAFCHTATTSTYPNNCSGSSTGWYIDHIRITSFSHFCECDLNQDEKCDMLDWLLFGQDWGRTDCGTPPGSGTPPNDCECDLNHDGKCDMLDWLRFGEDWGNTECLVCP